MAVLALVVVVVLELSLELSFVHPTNGVSASAVIAAITADLR
ncbi:hypothetical protein ACFWPK_34105 [Nocardia sp. NPDC058519]